MTDSDHPMRVVYSRDEVDVMKKTMFAAGIQGDQGAGNDDEGSLSIDDVANEEFEEIEEDSDDSDDDDREPGSSDGDEGEQGDGADEGADDGKTSKRKWAGEFETPEELEEHYIKSLKAQKTGNDEGGAENSGGIPDLSDTELNTMSEQDSQDGTDFLQQYLRAKMSERNLEKHELAAIRRIDSEKGTDLLGDYHEARTARVIRKETAPFAAKTREEARAAFEKRERAIDESNVKEFGKSLKSLQEFVSSPKNVETVLQHSPIAHLIIQEFERSPATAHKLLLKEANSFRANQEEGKRAEKKSKSVRADSGGGSSVKPKGSNGAATIEDAWEQAEAELDDE